SSIDRVRRYAFHNQPTVALWNLARLAEALLALIHPEPDKAVRLATELLDQFQKRYESSYNVLCTRKLGLPAIEVAAEKNRELLSLMREGRADFTLTYRTLTECIENNDFSPLLKKFEGQTSAAEWVESY